MARPRKHPDARERVLDAADALLARLGYARMTVELLATEAGLGKGTVYLCFASKEDVALGCIDRMAERLLERMRTVAAGPTPAGERLRALLAERVLYRFDYARTHSASLDALLAAFRPVLLARRERHFAAEAAVLAAVLRDGSRSGELTAADPAASAAALVTATNALLPYSLSAKELGRRRGLETRVAQLSDVLLHGVVHRPLAARRTTATPSRRTAS